MKALITYASWFGHTRTVARALSAELTRHGFFTACAPISRVRPADTMGFDLLVLGTYTHLNHACRRMCTFCQTIPQHRISRLPIAIFGTQAAHARRDGGPCGIDELVRCLAAREAEPVVPPLRINVRDNEVFHLTSLIGPQDQRDIQDFAATLWETLVPEPVLR
jgi:menaquinone-dependent protoporphyrinogen IX oxidase